MQKKQYTRAISLWMVGLMVSAASLHAQAQQCSKDGSKLPCEDLPLWISRIEQAAQQQSFTGTYIIVQPNQLTTIQTVHTFDQGVEYELVSRLDGVEQQVFRKNSEFYAISPQGQQIILERQAVAQMFPSFFKLAHGQPQQFYTLTLLYTERFIGRKVDVVHITPVDALRFGYKAWVDQATGLLLRLDVENAAGDVLQRYAFTNIELDSPAIQKTKLTTYIETLKKQGYQIQEWPFAHTSSQKEGWQMLDPPPGFEPISTVLRPLSNLSQELIQWVFSDGVASVSIFIETKKAQDEDQAAHIHSYGATRGVSYPLDQWQITLVGEVPEDTLTQFAHALERLPDERSVNKDGVQ